MVDLAGMRDAIVGQGGQADQINPEIPVDLVIVYSVQVDFYGCDTAQRPIWIKSLSVTMSATNFSSGQRNHLIIVSGVPPATGIIHQVNIEFLSDVCHWRKDGQLYPDSMFGLDSLFYDHDQWYWCSGLGCWWDVRLRLWRWASYFPVPEVIGVRLLGEKLPRLRQRQFGFKGHANFCGRKMLVQVNLSSAGLACLI